MISNEDKELLRHATLKALAARHPVAVMGSGVRRRVERAVDFQFTDDDLESSLLFLKGQGFVEVQPDEFGSSKWWTATAAGLLKVERG